MTRGEMARTNMTVHADVLAEKIEAIRPYFKAAETVLESGGGRCRIDVAFFEALGRELKAAQCTA